MGKNRLIDRYLEALTAAESENTALKTLEKARLLRVPPNPIHYTLLFDYLAEVDPFLMEQLETALKLKAYNDDTADELYQRYITHLISRHLPVDQAEDTLRRMKEELERWLEEFSSEHNALRVDIETLREDHHDIAEAIIDKVILPRLEAIEKRSENLVRQVEQFAVQMERLRAKLTSSYEEARTDPLSTLLNRRGLMEALKRLVSEAEESDTPFAVIMCDIDHFKRINDNYGHTVGDSVIRYVARVLKNETKGQDLVARLGGEEFVVVLPNTSYEGARHVAEKIRETIANKKLAVRLNNKPLRFTLSAGVAMWRPGESIEDVFERADRALYRAKQQGRNRVVGGADLL
ncbi:diguanylate cyclase [Sulfurivirga caldicuralii]|uniref:diguanylate cyclase n=1 Tax=Sulfurivirga caldicuralii TaxID=364032 RepID=A0A1N6GMG2_9GAMM|nr:GGDEF domain-containing protein [Sulfurivirga caldicuralii]SIO08710.1 diguanylate cyclase [Sulfurivirga caldicuralii]